MRCSVAGMGRCGSIRRELSFRPLGNGVLSSFDLYVVLLAFKGAGQWLRVLWQCDVYHVSSTLSTFPVRKA